MPTQDDTTPELPVVLHVDGSIGAVDFLQRLRRAGLEISTTEDGDKAVLKLTEPQEPKLRDPQGIRVSLWQAQGVAYAVRCALSSDVERDADQLQNALDAAGHILDEADAELEGWRS